MNAPTPAVISGEYADYRRVKGRKVLQLIVEVPLERAPEIHRMLGEPEAGEQKFVAIALLDKAKLSEQAQVPKRATRASKCAIVCGDARFWRFLNDRDGRQVIDTAEAAAEYARAHCGVTSRSDLNVNPEAAERWERLHGDFLAWLEM